MKKIPHGLAMVLAAGLSPALARWAETQQRRILREGVGLPAEALVFAKSLGIERADELRVLVVDPIPLPVPRVWVRVAEKLGLPVFPPGGMALGRGIFLLPGHGDSLPHELVHLLQYQRLGGISAFMRRYVFECLSQGYFEANLEIEARNLSAMQK